MAISRNHRALSRALVLLAGVAGLSAASAQSIDVTAGKLADALRTVQVGYGDLDLAQDQDRARLDRRVRFAAREVCGSGTIKGLDARTLSQNCTLSAVEGANAQIRAVTQTMAAGGGDGGAF